MADAGEILDWDACIGVCAHLHRMSTVGSTRFVPMDGAASPRLLIHNSLARGPQVEAVIVRLKREYPGWGAPKIREKLRR